MLFWKHSLLSGEVLSQSNIAFSFFSSFIWEGVPQKCVLRCVSAFDVVKSSHSPVFVYSFIWEGGPSQMDLKLNPTTLVVEDVEIQRNGCGWHYRVTLALIFT